jgi:uncharacterized protein (TIGR02145 family)
MKHLPLILFVAASSIALTACDDVRVEKYPNGNIRFEATYVDNKKEGLEKEYYDDGTLKRESNFANDRREGITKEYYKDGTLQTELPYSNGYIEGTVIRYHKNGKMASKAEYKQNKQVAFGETFNEDGTPATSGSYKDPRDGNSYEWIVIGDQLWTAENMNYATASGAICSQCNHWGRLYNFENAKKACLEGFHMPSKAEWQKLLKVAGKKPGVVLKAGYGWDPIKPESPIFGNGKDELGFGAKAGGAHFAKSDVPIKDRKFDEAGKKAYFWTSEGEVLVFFHNKDIAKFEQFDPEFGASLRCIKD